MDPFWDMTQTNFSLSAFSVLDLQGNTVRSALKVTAATAPRSPVCLWATLALPLLQEAGRTSWRSRGFVLHEALHSGPVPVPWSPGTSWR